MIETNNIQINPYTEIYREQILVVWEKSVLATHNFLLSVDFEQIKLLVSQIDFNDLQVFCLIKETLVLGFIGVADQKVEMLFLDPQYFRQGLGQKLLIFAVKKLNANKVDVNEQNSQGFKFYQKFGFETFERTDKDDQGKNYPLLRMKLVEQ
jgi:putative acetyltransferase